MKDILTQISEKITSSKLFEAGLRVPTPFFIGEVGELAKSILTCYFYNEFYEVRGKAEKKRVVFITEKKLLDSGDIINNTKALGQEDIIWIKPDNIEEINLPKNRKKAVFIDFESLFTRVVSFENYQESIFELKIGEKYDIAHQIPDHLVSIGYSKVKKVGNRGEFSIKGDILEINSFDRHYRIDFFGDEVEKISLLNVETQNFASVQGITVNPNKIPEGTDFFLKYFQDFIFIIDGEDQFNNSFFSYFSSDDYKVSEQELEQLKDLEAFVKKQKLIYLEPFHVGQKHGINLSWFAPKNYKGAVMDFVQDVRENQKSKIKNQNYNSKLKNREIFIVTDKVEGLKKLFLENSIDVGANGRSPVQIFTGHVSEGVEISDLGITIFSDKEIFGQFKTRKKKKIDFSAITKLKKGEYVVHIDHGIGIFTGFGEKTVDKISREYIFIEYGGGDKIYVPLDQADKITKYISVGNQPPLLSSLKTNQWLKVRKRVQENVEKIAKDLIETQALRTGDKKYHYLNDEATQTKLARTFAYKTTPDQQKAIEDVLSDMMESKPMDRLVCGDVGYGKTEVAIRAAARVVDSGGQVAILAPTTILAEQHLQTFRERLEFLHCNIESLSRFHSAKEQKDIVKKVAIGNVDIVIGTHRLLSADMKFKNLMMIVIDEEQKFGVKHKEKLKRLRDKVDILTMTATPIPRTLYMGLSGLKDISVISTPPEGRLPIKTIVIKNDEEVVRDAIQKEVDRGGQVYFVHNEVRTIQAMAGKLKTLLPKVTFGIGHGQMGEVELAHIMNDFAAGKFQVLVCSTIIESGLDISTVNTLIVDKATKFGLSQMHQLRGRIGRSSRQAYAYFLYDSKDLVGNAARRLKTITEKGDLGSGYQLSLEDLDIRGSGNILGKEQHGSMQMVGVGYYLRLLEEAVENLKEGKAAFAKAEDEIKIDLPVSALIPDDYYEREEDKIKAYQALAALVDLDEVNDFQESLLANSHELVANFTNGEKRKIPKEYSNLIEIVKLKIMAKNADIKSIIVKDVLSVGEVKKKKLYIEFNSAITKEDTRKILASNGAWYFGNMLIRIDLDKLGEDWLRRVEGLVEGLGND